MTLPPNTSSEAVERSNGYLAAQARKVCEGAGTVVLVQKSWLLNVADALEANGAAPDLLAALQAVLKDYEQLIDSGDCGHCSPASQAHEVITARAAIAKAQSQ